MAENLCAVVLLLQSFNILLFWAEHKYYTRKNEYIYKLNGFIEYEIAYMVK